MQPAAGAEQLTVQAWAALPEDEPGELCDGRLDEEEQPDLTHETAVSWSGARSIGLGPEDLMPR